MSTSSTVNRPTLDRSVSRTFAIAVGVSVLFIFLQSITAGEFISDGLSESAKQVWTDLHGLLAYPVMVATLAVVVIAARGLRRDRDILVPAVALFAGSVVQWLLGHAITGLGWDWVTPFHVALAFVIYGLAILLSVKSAGLRRGH